MFILATEQFKIIFFSNAEALRRLHSHKFSVSQTPDRTGNLHGLPGSPGRVCLWAQDSKSCAGKVFASHPLQAGGSELVEKVQEIRLLEQKCSCRLVIHCFSNSFVPYITTCNSL